MRITIAAVALIFLTSAPIAARGVEVDATSSTQYLRYQDFQSNPQDQNDIAEYLRLNVNQLGPGGNISVHGYGRFIGQLSTSVEDRPQLFGKDTVGRLYYLYVDYKDVLKDRLDLRGGRMYVTSAAATGTVDGLYLNLKNLGPAGVTLFGGRQVQFDNKGEIDGSDSLWGGSLYVDTVKNTHAEVSYARKYSDSDLAQEYVAFDVASTPLPMLGLTGRVRYDLASSRCAEVLVAADVTPIKDLVLRGEFFSSYPTFDKFSFYHFFNVDNYQALSIAADYRLNSRFSLRAKYAHEDFNESSTGDLVDAGIFVSPIENLTLNASYEWRDGYAGKLNGLKFNGAYRFFGRAVVQAGIDYDDFTRVDARSDTAKKYWAAFSFDVNKAISASFRIESDVNFYMSDAWRGFVAANVHL
jgi:hypothetical protein